MKKPPEQNIRDIVYEWIELYIDNAACLCSAYPEALMENSGFYNRIDYLLKAYNNQIMKTTYSKLTIEEYVNIFMSAELHKAIKRKQRKLSEYIKNNL